VGTTSTTLSIEIDAPVETVFAFLADPVKAVQAFPMGRNVTVSDIMTTREGALRSYRETMPMRLGPVHWDMGDTVTVQEYVPNQRIVDTSSTGPIHEMSVEPSTSGTKLTFTGTVNSRIPLLDKVKVFVFTQGRGQARNMQMVLAEVKNWSKPRWRKPASSAVHLAWRRGRLDRQPTPAVPFRRLRSHHDPASLPLTVGHVDERIRADDDTPPPTSPTGCIRCGGPPVRWAVMNPSTSDTVTCSGGVDRAEQHLQVVADGQHRVRPTPPGHERQVVIQHRHTQPNSRLTHRVL
jgi:uncharacterized protein YndB with AHSA1/START domain